MFRIKIEELNSEGKVIRTFPPGAPADGVEAEGFFIVVENGDNVTHGGRNITLNALETALIKNPEIKIAVIRSAEIIYANDVVMNMKGGSGNAPC